MVRHAALTVAAMAVCMILSGFQSAPTQTPPQLTPVLAALAEHEVLQLLETIIELRQARGAHSLG